MATSVSSPSLLSRSPALDVMRERVHDEKLRVVTTQTAAGLGWTAVALGVGFALKLVMARTMAAEAMGVVLAAQSFVALALVLAALGLPDAVVRYVGRDGDRRSAPKRTVYRALAIAAPATVLTASACLAGLWMWFAPRMSADARWATAIVIVTLPLLGIGDVLGAAFRGINRLATKLVLIDVARPAFVLVALLLSPLGLTRYASYVAGLYAAGVVISGVLLWALFARDERWTDTGGSTARDLLRFGLPIAGSAVIAGPLVNSIIPLMLTTWSGPAAVAFFAIALSLQGLVYLPIAVFEQAVIPTWSRLASDDAASRLRVSYRQATNICLAAAACLGLVLIANDRAILAMLYGPSYAAADWVVRWAVAGALFCAMLGPSEGMLRALGLAPAIFHARTIAAVTGVSVGFLLIPEHGLAGAVAAFIAIAVLLNSAYGVVLYWTRGIHPFSRSHAITLAMVAAALTAVTVLPRVSPLGASASVHALALLVVVVNADLRATARELLASVAAGLQQPGAVFRVSHILTLLHPRVAQGLTRLLRGESRQIVSTSHGRFWIDPMSEHGRYLAAGVEAEPDFIETLRTHLSSGCVFVDLGANEGYFTIQASRRCGAAGRVYAIEPQPRCWPVIERNCELNQCGNVRLLSVAVADYDGTQTLYLHPATNTGATSIVRSSRLAWHSVRVPCRRLETLLDAEHLQTVDLLKIDIEGAEYEGVLGSPSLFRSGRVRALSLEYHPAILRRRGRRIEDIHNFLIEAGYRVDALSTWPLPDTGDSRVIYTRAQ